MVYGGMAGYTASIVTNAIIFISLNAGSLVLTQRFEVRFILP
jgi:hypothetical protein